MYYSDRELGWPRTLSHKRRRSQVRTSREDTGEFPSLLGRLTRSVLRGPKGIMEMCKQTDHPLVITKKKKKKKKTNKTMYSLGTSNFNSEARGEKELRKLFNCLIFYSHRLNWSCTETSYYFFLFLFFCICILYK